MHDQNENISEEVETMKESQTEILQLKNTITELKDPLEGCNRRLGYAEERIRELKGKTFKTILAEEQK